jgi:predicted ATPase
MAGQPFCDCTERHHLRRIVLTGGPGAGKTATLELIRQSFCEHVHILPEAASIIFGGGFPRIPKLEGQRAAQRAIFHVQRELEVAAANNSAILLCDRGTVDGAAYWPGPDDLFESVETTLHDELRRYDAVIHLRTPGAAGGYQQNLLRTESAAEAALRDAKIFEIWQSHPRRYIVEAVPDFLTKAARVLEIIRGEMPDCCAHHVVPRIESRTPNPESRFVSSR